MKLLAAITVLLIAYGCTVKKNEQLLMEEVYFGGSPFCQNFYDSMVALADTPVEENEEYSHLYYMAIMYDTLNHLTYPLLHFNTGDKEWDKMLDKEVAKQVNEQKKWWSEEEFWKTDTSEEGRSMWERCNYSVEATPVYVSDNWLTLYIGNEGYGGGAHGFWEKYYIHFYRDNQGNLKQVLQKNFFIYDKDTSVNYAFYHRILKGMSTEVKCDTIYFEDSCQFHAYHSFYGHTISMKHFLTPAYEGAPEMYKYNLIPTKSGLKTAHFSVYGEWSWEADFSENIIIPYKNFEGVIHRKYLDKWQNP